MNWRHIAVLVLCLSFMIPLASAGTPTSLNLTADPATVIANGVDYSKIRATLKDQNGDPVNGAYINFSIGNNRLLVKTNFSGIASIRVGPSSSIQTVVVNASTTGNLNSSVVVAFVPAVPDSIHLYASPSSVGTRSITSTNYTSLILARVLDKYKNPVPNQQVNFTIYLRKANGTVSNPPDFTLNPAGTHDGSGNVSITISTDTKGAASLTFNSGNTSGTAYITARAGALSTSSNLKILGESYLLVETSVEPEIIDPPAIVNVTITVKGGGDNFTGGMPVDAVLVTDVSGSMDPDWFNRWSDGESLVMWGLTEYKFKANGTVAKKSGGVDGQWSTTFYLNESVNDLWFKLNVTGLRLQLISPNGTKYGYGGTNSPSYMYSYDYPGSRYNPEWVWFKPDSTPGNLGYYPTSPDSYFPEQGNWTVKIFNKNSYPISFNLSSYIEKLSATKIASKTFNGLLNPAYDRVGLVPFTGDTDPLPLYNLTSDIASINGAIDLMFARDGTPTAAAIKRATDELIAKMRSDTLRYIVLLSDGRPTIDLNGTTCSYDEVECIAVCRNDAINEANKAKEDGIRIYTIGIGVDADEATLRAVASNDSYYFAANASQLKEIYGNIGRQITSISAKQASLNITLSSGQSYSANGTYVTGSSMQKYIKSENNETIEYNCLGNACEPNTTSPLYWDIKTPYPPDNKTIKIGDQWILKFQLNLSNDGMLFDLKNSTVDYMNYTMGNLSITVPGAKVNKNATTLKPQGLLVKTVILTISKDRVRPNGVSSSTITATIYDEEDNLVPDGTDVRFDTNFGSFSNHSITFNVTTSNGIATAKIYSEVAGPAQINARSWADWQWPNYAPSNQVNVTFAYNKIITIS